MAQELPRVDQALIHKEGWWRAVSAKKGVDAILREVIADEWGNDNARKSVLVSVGYDYEAVQVRVNELLR